MKPRLSERRPLTSVYTKFQQTKTRKPNYVFVISVSENTWQDAHLSYEGKVEGLKNMHRPNKMFKQT